ncbi:MAG: stage II sporulation protein M [Nitrososphaera sp.]
MLLTKASRYFTIPYRIGYLGLGMLLFIGSYSAGAAMPLTDEDAEEIRSGFLEDIENIDETGIFLNNLQVALAMFVPGVGVGLGIFSGLSTGEVYNAFALVTPSLAATSPLSVLATPFGILEVFAYGLAISRSGILVAQLVKKEERKSWRQFSLVTAIEVAVVVAVLIAGSVVEFQIISETDGQA